MANVALGMALGIRSLHEQGVRFWVSQSVILWLLAFVSADGSKQLTRIRPVFRRFFEQREN